MVTERDDTREEDGGPGWDRLAEYFAGTLPPGDAQELARWIASDPARAAEVRALRATWDATGGQSHYGDRHRAWAAVSAAMMADRRRTAAVPLPDFPRGGGPRWRSWLTGSAVVGVVALGVVWGAMRRAERATIVGAAYATANGERAAIRLADGTRITLAPATRIRVSPRYGAGDRSVVVEGEAYFAVVHDATHPFIVRAKDAVVRDVGTEFDVRAYAEDAAPRVAVAAGEVAIGPVYARAGEVATVGPDGASLERGADVAALTSWTAGLLAFSHTPLREAVRELGRWYDLDVRVDDAAALANERITATFGREPAADVLAAIAAAVGAQIERRGRVVTFVPR